MERLRRMQCEIINPKLTRKFVYVVAGIAGYETQDEKSIITMLARLRAEARLTESNWNLFGYSRTPSVGYFEDNLDEDEVDAIIVPQNSSQELFPTDQDEWKKVSESKQSADEVFPDNPSNASREDNHESTWYLSPNESKRGHWIKEVPRFFQIWSKKGDKYRGLVLKNLTLYKYGDLCFDGSNCRYFTTGTNFKRNIAHGRQIYEILDEAHSSPEYIPVIATAKTVYPYAVDLVHPDDRE